MTVLGRISAFFSTAREVGRFKRLIKEISAPSSIEQSMGELDAVMSGKRTKEDALVEFTTWIAQRAGIAAVLTHYGYTGPAAQEKLVSLYWDMLRIGAARHVGTKYAPAMVIYDPDLLSLILKAEADGEPQVFIAVTTLDYCYGTDLMRLLLKARAEGGNPNLIELEARALVDAIIEKKAVGSAGGDPPVSR